MPREQARIEVRTKIVLHFLIHYSMQSLVLFIILNHSFYSWKFVEVLKRLPNVAKIDGDMVKPAERELAAGIAASWNNLMLLYFFRKSSGGLTIFVKFGRQLCSNFIYLLLLNSAQYTLKSPWLMIVSDECKTVEWQRNLIIYCSICRSIAI